MKCPNCGETVKENAKVCFTCGEDLTKHDIDHIIKKMIKEDDAEKASSAKKAASSSRKSSETSQKTPVKSVTKVRGDVQKQVVFGRAFRITAYVNCIAILILMISMLFSWFTFGGRGVREGFEIDQNSGPFMTDVSINMTNEEFQIVDPTLEIFKFSPKTLLEYTQLYEDGYKQMPNAAGELKTSYAIVIHTLYIKGFYLIGLMGLLSIILLILDKGLKSIEFTRGFAALSILIIGLNYIALKVTFFSMFALKARNVLRLENQLTSVTLNLNGINVHNEFYPYILMEKPGFYVALVACILWFVISTVLIEMKKDKEFK